MRAQRAVRDPRGGPVAATRPAPPRHGRPVGVAAVLDLQRKAGNIAVAGLLAGRRADPVVQRCGDIPPERCPCHDGTDAVDPVQRQAPGGPAPAPASLPVVGIACDPYSFAFEADAVHRSLTSTFLPAVGGGFGSEAQGLWSDYLSRALPLPRPLRTFDTAGGQIVGGFTRHAKTASTEALLLDLAAAALRTTPRALPANTPVTIPLSDLVAPGTVWTTLNFGADRMRFDGTTTIPGLLAGGIDPAADTRNAWGEVVVVNHTDASGATNDLTIEPRLTFKVEDNVKFCPGNPGPFFIQPLTIPLSRLEATRTSFGAPFAGTVPFWVLFAGPGTTKSFGTTVPVAPPGPTPPSPPPGPTRRTGPARTTGTHLRIRSGPGTEHPVVEGLPRRDTPITVLEQVEGTEIRGNNRWDRVEGGWVSDSYVEFDARP